MSTRNQYKIYFISGVSGVGKTSTLNHLKSKLSPREYDVRDLDERGVPNGGGLIWLNNETRYWHDVAKANASNGKNTIVCGFANPELFKKVYKKDEDIPAQLILLHASGKSLEDRLRGRHTTPKSIKEIERASGLQIEQFIKSNVEFSPQLFEIFQKNGYPIVQTDNKTPSEVTDMIIKLIA